MVSRKAAGYAAYCSEGSGDGGIALLGRGVVEGAEAGAEMGCEACSLNGSGFSGAACSQSIRGAGARVGIANSLAPLGKGSIWRWSGGGKAAWKWIEANERRISASMCNFKI
jgi:hypothetical protein